MARSASNAAQTNGARLAVDGGLRDASGALGGAESQLLAEPDSVLRGVLNGERVRVCAVAPSTTVAPGGAWPSNCATWTYTDSANTGKSRFEVTPPGPASPNLSVKVLSRKGGVDTGYSAKYALSGSGRWVWASTAGADLTTASPSQTVTLNGSVYAVGAVSPNVGAGGVTLTDTVVASESGFSVTPTNTGLRWYGPAQSDIRTVQPTPVRSGTLTAAVDLARNVACQSSTSSNISSSVYTSGLCFKAGATAQLSSGSNAVVPTATQSYMLLVGDGTVRVYASSRSIDTSATSALLCSSCSLPSQASTLMSSSSHPGNISWWTSSGGALLGDFRLPVNGVIAFDGDVSIGVCSDTGNQYPNGQGCQSYLGATESGLLARQSLTVVAGESSRPRSLIVGSPLRANQNVQIGLVASDRIVLPYWIRPNAAQTLVEAHLLAAGLSDPSRASIESFPSSLTYAGANDANWADRLVISGSVTGVKLNVGLAGWRDVIYQPSTRATSVGGPPWFAGLDASWSRVSATRYSGVQSCGTKTCGNITVAGEVQAAPAAPYDVTCAPSSTVISCTWLAGTQPGAGPTTSYTVYVNGSAVTTTTSTNVSVTPLTAGTTYNIVIAATGPGGETQAASSAYLTSPACPSVTATAQNGSSTSIDLTWPSVSSATSYSVYIDGSAVASYSGANTSYTDSSGATNSTHTYKVTATNSGGASGPCSTTTATTGPGTPTLGALAVSGTSYSATWTGGSGASTWQYEASRESVGVVHTGTVSSATFTWDDSVGGVRYQYRARAVNSSGTYGAWSSLSALSGYTTTNPPVLNTVTAGTNQVALSWTTPTSGGATVSDYTVSYKLTSGSTWSTFAHTASTATSITVTGLTGGQSYDFRVAAVNSTGTSGWSSTLTTVAITTPGAPSGVTVSYTYPNLAVAWSAPASTGGASISSYQVTCTPTSGTAATATVGGSTLTSSVTPVTYGVAHTCVVKAANSAGWGTNSTASASVTPFGIPGSPTAVSATAGVTSAAVSWTAPASNGGSAITSYKATASPGGLFCTSAASPCTVSGLTAATAYTFTVTATNTYGTSSASAASGSVTPYTTPGAPTISTVSRGFTVSGSVSNASIAFTAGSTNGAAITNNTVSCTSSTGGVATSGSGAVSPISVTGFTQRATYTCTMTSTNSAGASAASAATAAFMAWGVPAAPASVSIAEASSQSKTLYISVVGANSGGQNLTSMTASCTSSNGGPALSYTWSASLGASPDGSYNNQTYTWPTQYAGKQYTCSATATNPAGTSAATGSNAVTLYGYPTPYGTPYGAVYGAVYGGVYAGPYGYPGPYPGQYGGPYPGQYGGPYGGPSTR